MLRAPFEDFSLLFLVFGAVKFGGVDHVSQGCLGLGPLAGLETAVWVDPELVWCKISMFVSIGRIQRNGCYLLKHLLDSVLDLLLAGDTRRVDVVDTWADVAGISLIDEDLQQLGVALAILDGENISVQSGNGMEKVLELGIAEMGVDLGGIDNASGGELEGVDSP